MKAATTFLNNLVGRVPLHKFFNLPMTPQGYYLLSIPVVYSNINHMRDYLDSHLLTGHKALDIGSGPGGFSRYLRDKRKMEVTSIEPSKHMRAFSRWLGTRAIDGTAQSLPIDGPFDLVIAFHLLRYIPPDDTHNVLSRISRVTKNMGVLVISDFILPEFNNVIIKEKFSGMWSGLNSEGMIAEVEKYGFRITDLRRPFLSHMMIFRRIG